METIEMSAHKVMDATLLNFATPHGEFWNASFHGIFLIKGNSRNFLLKFWENEKLNCCNVFFFYLEIHWACWVKINCTVFKCGDDLISIRFIRAVPFKMTTGGGPDVFSTPPPPTFDF